MTIMLVMIFIPFFPQRAAFPANIFLLISSLAAFCVLHMAACLYVYFAMYAQIENRWEIIEANRNADEIVVPYLEIQSWSETIIGQRTWTQLAIDWGADFEPYFEGNRNIMFAQYYGLKKIRAEQSPT